jgi:acyl carrier protein
MDRDSVRDFLVKVIAEVQEQSGREIASFDDDTKPFSDLEGFDSLNGEEVTILLREELSFPEDVNPFDSDNEEELTIGQIADHIASLATPKEKAS